MDNCENKTLSIIRYPLSINLSVIHYPLISNFQKILQNSLAGCARLFRVKLHGVKVFVSNRRAEIQAVIARRNCFRSAFDVKAMNEIDKRIFGDVIQQIRFQIKNIVPADLRNFQNIRLKLSNPIRQDSQTFRFVFLGRFTQ